MASREKQIQKQKRKLQLCSVGFHRYYTLKQIDIDVKCDVLHRVCTVCLMRITIKLPPTHANCRCGYIPASFAKFIDAADEIIQELNTA